MTPKFLLSQWCHKLFEMFEYSDCHELEVWSGQNKVQLENAVPCSVQHFFAIFQRNAIGYFFVFLSCFLFVLLFNSWHHFPELRSCVWTRALRGGNIHLSNQYSNDMYVNLKHIFYKVFLFVNISHAWVPQCQPHFPPSIVTNLGESEERTFDPRRIRRRGNCFCHWKDLDQLQSCVG